MIERRAIKEEIVYDFLDYENEEDMQVICDKLSTHYFVAILEKAEGPGTIVWNLQIEGKDFFLANNSWGNFLRPRDEEAKAFIEREFNMLCLVLADNF